MGETTAWAASRIRRRLVQRWRGALLARDLTLPVPAVAPRAPVSLLSLSRASGAPDLVGLLAGHPGGEAFADRLARGQLGALARAGGAVAGYAWVGFDLWEFREIGVSVRLSPTECFLYDLFTEPAWRGESIGSALVAILMNDAIQRGCRAMYCRVGRGNAASHALFTRLGFEKVVDVFGLTFFGSWVLSRLRPDRRPEHAGRLLRAIDWARAGVYLLKIDGEYGVRLVWR
jgi:GNAT superfamily N-acetyltransferase